MAMSDTKKREPRPLRAEFMEILADNPMMEEHYPEIIGDMKAAITTGKLRVVEEVEVKTQRVTKRMDQFSGASYYDCELRCYGCSVFFQVKTVNEQANFCPGCGNKIKQ